MKPEVLQQARKLIYAQHFGILGTISAKLEGFPFGSVVPYCLDDKGRPVVLISTIAQHTRNIVRDDRCSLTITMGEDDIQAKGRICLIGHMKKVDDDLEEVKARYYRHFPHSRGYNTAHDFSFYVLDPISVRYIGGFGAIHWIEPDQFLTDNPFYGKGEQRIVDHMNEDHRHNLAGYLSHFKGIAVGEEEKVRMAGIQADGFAVFIGKKKFWFEFDQPVRTAVEAREALVAMARATK